MESTLKTESRAFGKHVIADLGLCRTALLEDLAFLRDAMIRAAIACGATVRETSFVKFSPGGVSGVVVLAESHIAVHTWPEHGYASVDIFTCGNCDPQVAAESLESQRPEIQVIERCGDVPVAVSQCA